MFYNQWYFMQMVQKFGHKNLNTDKAGLGTSTFQ